MKILFVDTGLPLHDQNSADLRMFSIVKLFAENQVSCDYCAISMPYLNSKLDHQQLTKYKKDLEDTGVNVHLGNIDKVLRDNQYDIIYFKYFYTAEKNVKKVRAFQKKATILVDSVDIIYARLMSKAQLSNDPNDLSEAKSIKKRELSTYDQSDIVITITPEDTAILKKDLPSIDSFIIPNIHNISEEPRNETAHPSLLFIGTFSHEPNVDAVLYFHKNIWPAVQKINPSIQLYVVGGNLVPEIQELACENITVTGYVPSTLPYLKKAWISIAPLRFGAGMKGKVGEAMAAGTPIVTTEFGAQGFSVVNGEHMFIAKNEVEFADYITHLIENRDTRSKFSKKGLDFIYSNYSSPSVSKTINSLIEKIKGSAASSRTIYQVLYKTKLMMLLWFSKHINWRFTK